MTPFRIRSSAEQVAAHLKDELVRGRWQQTMPGGDRLTAELGTRRSTVESALRQLEEEGILVGQGPRRRRLIKLPDDLKSPSMRVAILCFEPGDPATHLIAEIRHLLEETGHAPFFPAKTLQDLGMDVERVGRLVDQTGAHAWMIVAGSHEVLEWFASRPEPSFALFGRRHRVDIASVGPDTTPTISAVARRLIELGHQRIVMLSRRERRLPRPAQFERAFLNELAVHGCPTGNYALPDWESNKEGLHRLLGSLFELTPPTALIVHEAPQFIAVLRFLARRGIRIPEDVSLVCTDPDPSFTWCDPPMAHITWDAAKVIRRVARWASNIGRGREDRHRTDIKATFVEGGTIGPSRKHLAAHRRA